MYTTTILLAPTYKCPITYTIYIVQCTIQYNVQYTIYIVQYNTMKTIKYETLSNTKIFLSEAFNNIVVIFINYTMYIVQYNIHCTMCSIQCIHIVRCILYKVYIILYSYIHSCYIPVSHCFSTRSYRRTLDVSP